jgi:hypothetical protein
MKIKYLVYVVLVFFMGLNIIGLVMPLTPSAQWCASENDVYYITWTNHPLISGSYRLATPENPLYEKVVISYSGPAYAVHDPSAYFEHSLNVTGYLFNGRKFEPIDPSGAQTQLTLYNSSNDVWFCGGLFFGTPVIAPGPHGQVSRENTISTSCGVLWTGGLTVIHYPEYSPTRVKFTNGTRIISVGYENNGFLSYYNCTNDLGFYECTLSTEAPVEEQNDIPGYSTWLLGIVTLSVAFIIMKKSKIQCK